MVEYRIVWDYDQDVDYSYLDMTEKEYYKDGPYFIYGKELTFEEYKSIGFPKNHTFLMVKIEGKCEHCSEWSRKDDLYGIDFMMNDDWIVGTFLEGDLTKITNDDQRELSLDLLSNVKEEMETVKLIK